VENPVGSGKTATHIPWEFLKCTLTEDKWYGYKGFLDKTINVRYVGNGKPGSKNTYECMTGYYEYYFL